MYEPESKVDLQKIETAMTEWDHSSDEKFYDYFANESNSKKAISRFQSAQNAILKVCKQFFKSQDDLTVADIGCGPGTQALL